MKYLSDVGYLTACFRFLFYTREAGELDGRSKQARTGFYDCYCWFTVFTELTEFPLWLSSEGKLHICFRVVNNNIPRQYIHCKRLHLKARLYCSQFHSFQACRYVLLLYRYSSMFVRRGEKTWAVGMSKANVSVFGPLYQLPQYQMQVSTRFCFWLINKMIQKAVQPYCGCSLRKSLITDMFCTGECYLFISYLFDRDRYI